VSEGRQPGGVGGVLTEPGRTSRFRHDIRDVIVQEACRTRWEEEREGACGRDTQIRAGVGGDPNHRADRHLGRTRERCSDRVCAPLANCGSSGRGERARGRGGRLEQTSEALRNGKREAQPAHPPQRRHLQASSIDARQSVAASPAIATAARRSDNDSRTSGCVRTPAASGTKAIKKKERKRREREGNQHLMAAHLST